MIDRKNNSMWSELLHLIGGGGLKIAISFPFFFTTCVNIFLILYIHKNIFQKIRKLMLFIDKIDNFNT